MDIKITHKINKHELIGIIDTFCMMISDDFSVKHYNKMKNALKRSESEDVAEVDNAIEYIWQKLKQDKVKTQSYAHIETKIHAQRNEVMNKQMQKEIDNNNKIVLNSYNEEEKT